MRDTRLTGYARELRREMTEPETRLWLHLRAERFQGVKFRRRKAIGRYIADVAANAPKLVAEADGGTHDVDDRRDRARTAYLEEAGYRVVRLTNHEVMTNMEGVLIDLPRVIGALRAA